MICESFSNKEISDAYLKLDGYELVCRNDGKDTVNGKCRGLLIYALLGLQASRFEIEGAENCTECAGISVPWGGGEEIKLVMVYRPPTKPGSDVDGGNTARLCKSLSSLEGKVVLFGDFNMPGIEWEREWSANSGETMLLDLLADKFWQQIVRGPTHLAGNTLDLVIPSSSELVAGVETLDPLATSDHNMHLTTLVGPARNQSSKEEVPDWANADYEKMKIAFEKIDWDEEFNDKSGQDCLDVFYEAIHRETERCIPKKLRRKGKKPFLMNQNILRLLRKKRRLWKNYSSHPYYKDDFQSFQAYKTVQGDVKKAVRQAKRKLERSLAKAAKNSKQFFSYLKKKTSNRVTVGPLKDGERVVTDDKEMADMLNGYFCSVFTQENMADMKEPEQLFKGDQTLKEMTFTEEKVKKKLTDLKPSSAPGPDGVWTKVLHQLADSLAFPLSIIFSKLFQEGYVPEIWRKANVCPIFKKGVKGDPANYRPISLTCVICKIMESLIRDDIVTHLSKNNLIRSSQHGFVPRRSTATNLLEYMETLTKLLDEGHAVDVLYLDFAKAFDKVPHLRLLAKCRGLGVDGSVLAWIQSWLTGRKQRVVLNGKFSDWADVQSGVPQGSVLGPTLFIMFINDIDLAVDVTGSFLLKFADDTKVGMVVESEEQRDALQEGIACLETWSREWQMLFNTSKCHILHIGAKNQKFKYTMGGQVLEEIESEKDVGVMIHHSLKPSMQCAKAATNANQVLGQLARGLSYRDRNTFLRLYTVYVRPHLEYAVASWSPYTKGDKEILEKVQRRALAMVSNLKGKSYEERLAEVNMTTLEKRRERGDLITMYRIMTAKDDVDPSHWFQTLAAQSGPGTRQSSGLHNVLPQRSQGDVRRNFFSQRVVSSWNSLPDRVKGAGTVNCFKNRLDEHLLLHQA